MPVSRSSAYLTPTSGSEEISSWVYGCRGELTSTSVGAFSASFPAYITMIVSAIWYTSEMSCVITIRLSTNPLSRKPTSASATARWVDTSSAEVISSAISSDGLSSVASTMTARCFIPPDSSIG